MKHFGYLICFMFVYIVNDSVYQCNIYPRVDFRVEEVNDKALLRTTLIHKYYLLKVEARVGYNLIVSYWGEAKLSSCARFAS